MPEKSIAERYGTYQVNINRLRKKWGIPTLGKTKRLERSFDLWVEKFLRPMAERGADALSAGGYFVLNVADISINRRKIPLVEKSREILAETGLAEIEVLSMPLPALNRKSPREALLVFQRKSR